MDWTLTLEELEPILQPTESVMYKDRNGILNVRFAGYLPATIVEENLGENNMDLMNRENIDLLQSMITLGKKTFGLSKTR